MEATTMSEKLSTFNMETKFDGLIKLLAEGLYTEPDIFLRELIQNAHDSIVRRKEANTSFTGRINIVIDSENQSIIVEDNGIGMDESDIRGFLSVIGSTGTGTVREQGEDTEKPT
jgi:molecular chaperone HtpG